MSEFIDESGGFDGQNMFDQDFFEQTPLHGIAEYDERTRVLEDLLLSITTDLPDADLYKDHLAEEIVEISKLFGKVCLSIQKEYGSVSAQVCIASLIKLEDTKRVDYLRQLTSSESFVYFNDGQAEEFTSDLYTNIDSEEEISDVVGEIFQRSLHGDLEIFVTEIEKLRGQALFNQERGLKDIIQSWGRLATSPEAKCFAAGTLGAALGSIAVQRLFGR